MSITYTPSTNFGAKDSLPSNDSNKVIRGSEFTTEFTAIQTAFGLAAPAASPTFTGTVTISSVDINGGTIDGVTIGGSSAGAITGTTGQFSTSLNVDGTVTADGLTVDTTSATPNTFSDSTGAVIDLTDTGGATDEKTVRLYSTGQNLFISNRNDDLSNKGNRLQVANNGDISFYEDTGTTAKFFWDASAESLLVGTDSGDAFNSSALIRGQGTDAFIQLKSATTKSAGLLLGDTDDDFVGGIIYNNNSNFLSFHSSNEEAMRIDSSGNVGIGTSLPASLVAGGSSPVLSIGGTDSGLTTGEKAGALSFITSDSSYTTTYSDGITGEIVSVVESFTGAAYGLAFYTGTISGSDRGERVRIDNSGNVGIGDSSPNAKLHVANLTDAYVRLDGATSGGNYGVGVQYWKNGSEQAFAGVPYNASNTFIVNTGGSEAMRIDSSGNLLVGTTAGSFGSRITALSTTSYLFESRRTGTGSEGQMVFVNGNGAVGSIFTNASATAYNTSSDARLKENIADAEDAGAKVDAIQVRQFDWKADGSHQKYGMIAQELLTVAPEAVSGDPESDDMMGVDYSKLVPMLVKEIQSLRARMAQLEGA